MTVEGLIEEGRRLQRDSVFLKPTGTGEPAAVWHHEYPRIPNEQGFKPWLSIDTRFVPGFDSGALGWLAGGFIMSILSGV